MRPPDSAHRHRYGLLGPPAQLGHQPEIVFRVCIAVLCSKLEPVTSRLVVLFAGQSFSNHHAEVCFGSPVGLDGGLLKPRLSGRWVRGLPAPIK